VAVQIQIHSIQDGKRKDRYTAFKIVKNKRQMGEKEKRRERARAHERERHPRMWHVVIQTKTRVKIKTTGLAQIGQ
jgi:hypothetical protein